MFINVPFIKSTASAIVAEANLRCGFFCPNKSCRYSTCSFPFFLVFTTRRILSSLKDTVAFGGLLMRCLMNSGVCINLDFRCFFYLNMSFYVPFSDAVFRFTIFSNFEKSIWLV